MKLLVLSDTHGRFDRIDEVLRRQGRYDALLFLGDGIRDFGDTPTGFAAVRGNCDGFGFFSASEQIPDERTLVLDGFKLFMTHGCEYSVKSGLDRIIARGAELDADVVLYGHTHTRTEKYISADSLPCERSRGMYLFNPGSLGAPRDGAPSYGIIEIKRGNVLLSHGFL